MSKKNDNSLNKIMRINQLHEWDIGVEQARSVQKNLRAWINLEDQFSTIKTIARIKVKSLTKETLVKVNIHLLSYPSLKTLEKKSISFKASFPAVQGLSSFRHMPAVIEALKQLKTLLDLILCDGRGLVDEHSFGLASHIGLFTHKPCIGLSKIHKEMPLAYSLENTRGAWLPVAAGSQVIAALLRAKPDTQPIQVSPGYGISIDSAIKYVLECFPKELLETNSDSAAIDINTAKKKISA